MARFVTTLLVLPLAAASLMTGGCLLVAAGAAGAAGYVYVNGEYTETVDTPYARGWDAANAAVADLGYRVKTKSNDALEGKINAAQADDTNVWITVTKSGENATKFVVRVGVTGNEAASRMIMEKIKSKV